MSLKLFASKRSSFLESIYSSNTHNKIWFYLCYVLFIFNDRFLHNASFERFLWDYIKLELFYISGECRHSGNCCRGIMLYDKGVPVATRDEFQSYIKQKPVYQRFTPKVDQENTVLSYNCSCLTKDNRCSDYQNRPLLCHHYPGSYFVQHDHILEGCGYSVQKTSFQPKINYPKLRCRVQNLILLNGLARVS